MTLRSESDKGLSSREVIETAQRKFGLISQRTGNKDLFTHQKKNSFSSFSAIRDRKVNFPALSLPVRKPQTSFCKKVSDAKIDFVLFTIKNVV